MITIDATNLPRFMACNGSIFMPADPAFAEHDDTIRNEGNAAHWLASVVHSGSVAIQEATGMKAPNGVFITAEMAEHVADYLLYATGEMEINTSVSSDRWRINGRADHILLSEWNTLHVDDFKYGYSIIEPENNWTLLAHAIGYCRVNNVNPHSIILTIHQPRAPHREGRARTWKITPEDLQHYYERIDAALTDPGDWLATGKHCYKCPAFLSCPARQEAELNAIEASATAYKSDVPDNELAFRLDQIARAMDVLKQSEKAYQELATHRINQGVVIANYAVEADFANRTWRAGVTAPLIRALTGVDIAEQAPIKSPRQAELAGVSPDIVALFTERKPKGAKLVRVNANKKATKLFGKK